MESSVSSRELAFGTSGLRGLVRDMTDREIHINVRGFLDYLFAQGELRPGDTVVIARDLREVDPQSGLSSSPRIAWAVARAVEQAVRERGDDAPALRVHNCGRIPTPALAAYAMGRGLVGIMVTGSHIPADRNGVKFYKRAGEVLKSDEAGILEAVRRVRRGQAPDEAGGLRERLDEVWPVDRAAEGAYRARYLSLFPGQRPLDGMRLVFYQHSAVGRDLLVEILRALGAEVIPVERSDSFVAIDTEEVRPADEARFRSFAAAHRPYAVVSTDGDSDRPFVIDETGVFHRGDALGIVVADFLGARFAAVPVSTTDALELWVARSGAPLDVRRTRIGSPHVIREMNDAIARGEQGVVGWEANGGFLLGTPFRVNGQALPALPTRDALLPILAALLSARRRGGTVSELFASLPQRITRAGLVDDFPVAAARALIAGLSPPEPGIAEVDFRRGGHVALVREDGSREAMEAEAPLARQMLARRAGLAARLSAGETIERVVYVDGVRAYLGNGDIAHLRPSGNAPQMRVYAVSDTAARADRIVERALLELTRIVRLD